jgi:hypothetical protein
VKGETIMPHPLREDIKERALKKCTGDLAYLQVQDPGSTIEVDGRVWVMVMDQKEHRFWIEV